MNELKRTVDGHVETGSKNDCGYWVLAGLLIDEAAPTRRAPSGSGRDSRGEHHGLFGFADALVFCLWLTIACGWVRAGEPVYDIDIPSTTAAEALNRFAEQTGTIMLFPYDLASTRQTNAVHGRYTLLDGLELLLRNTGLSGGLLDKRVVSISPVEEERRVDGGEAMPKRKVSLGKKVVAFVGSIFAASGASAQDTGSHAQPLEEIVVTATKRETNLQDVPVSVSVVDGDFFSELRANDISDLVQFVPNLSWQDGRESKVRAFNIRGVGTATFNDGVEDSVGVVVDGVTLGRAAMGLYDMYDVERVEVLRGPQGTLFGRSASAGVVSIVTKDPNTEKFEADSTLSYGDHVRNGEWKANGAISGPINDQVAYRLAGYYNDRQGIVHDFYRNVDDHTKKQWGTRGKLLVQPTDEFSAKLTVDYLEEDSQCCADIPILAFPGGRLDTLVSQYFTIDENNRNIAQDAPSYNTNEVGGAALELNYDVAGYTLTSITAYRTWEHFKATDEDKSPDNFFDRTTTDTDVRQFTQELRLASPAGEGRFDYLVGIHTYNQNLNSLEIFSAFLGADTEQNHSISPVRVDATSIGIFGSGTYRFDDRWNLIVGLRYQHEDLDGSVEHNEVGPVALFPEVKAAETNSDSAVTGRLGVQYYPSDGVMLFATYGTGYKSPAFNSGILQAPGQPSQIAPAEKSEMFEIGAKSRWLDGRLQANVTLFDMTFDDFQADVLILPEGSDVPLGVLSSVEEISSRGVELELTSSVTDYLLLGAAFGYTDAQFESFQNSPCYSGQTAAEGCNETLRIQDLSGKPLPFQGEFQYNVFFDYDRDFAGFGLFAQGNYSWVDNRNTDWTLDPQMEVDSVGLLSARIGVALADRVELALFGNNLTDENYATKIRRSGLGGGYFRYAGIPRVVGISGTIRF